MPPLVAAGLRVVAWGNRCRVYSFQLPAWAPPRGYSNGAVAAPGRRILTVAGQIGWTADAQMIDPAAGEDAFVAQFRQALQNVVEG